MGGIIDQKAWRGVYRAESSASPYAGLWCLMSAFSMGWLGNPANDDVGFKFDESTEFIHDKE